jgi:hypothetical protein
MNGSNKFETVMPGETEVCQKINGELATELRKSFLKETTLKKMFQLKLLLEVMIQLILKIIPNKSNI